MMLTVTQYARKKKLSRSRIHQLIVQRRIEGAQRHGGDGQAGIWLIAPDARILPPLTIVQKRA